MKMKYYQLFLLTSLIALLGCQQAIEYTVNCDSSEVNNWTDVVMLLLI